MSKIVWTVVAVIAIFSFVNVGSEAEAVHAPEASRLWKALSAKEDQLDESEVLLRDRRAAENIIQDLLNCILTPIKALLSGGITAIVQNLLGAVLGMVCRLIASISGLVQTLISAVPDLGIFGSIKVGLGEIMVDLNLQLNELLQGLGGLLGGDNIVCSSV